jgi:hypothetical protein
MGGGRWELSRRWYRAASFLFLLFVSRVKDAFTTPGFSGIPFLHLFENRAGSLAFADPLNSELMIRNSLIQILKLMCFKARA